MSIGLRARAVALAVLSCVGPAVAGAGEPVDRSRLEAILKKSEAYCRRLEKAALDFVCLEEVTELSVHFTPQTNVYLYDYQFVRTGREKKENRRLVSVNGKKRDVKDAPLGTVMFRYENVLFGPIGLLDEDSQRLFDYALVGEATVGPERAAIIEAGPKPGARGTRPYGRIWIKEEDGSVLRIDWDPASLGNYRAIEEWTKAHDATPRITAYSEYGLEKNGLRFPSRNFSETATVTKGGLETVSGRMSTVYKDYKFFIVETEVKYQAPGGA
jgi:hypothetical protein